MSTLNNEQFHDVLQKAYSIGRTMDEARGLPPGTRLLCYCVSSYGKEFDFCRWRKIGRSGYWATDTLKGWRPVLWWPLPKVEGVEG